MPDKMRVLVGVQTTADKEGRAQEELEIDPGVLHPGRELALESQV